MKIFNTELSMGKIFQGKDFPQSFTFEDIEKGVHYKWLPFIYNGKFNPDLETTDVRKVMLTLEKLYTEIHADSHRLAKNYGAGALKYEEMYVFGIVWDLNKMSPVCFSGLQEINQHCARLLSRYYVFTDYRPNGKHTFTNDIDDYAMLKIQKLMGGAFDMTFISRDTNPKYFNRLKKYRGDVYGDFEIYPETVELLFKDNHQNLFYRSNMTTVMLEQYITSLKYSGD